MNINVKIGKIEFTLQVDNMRAEFREYKTLFLLTVVTYFQNNTYNNKNYQQAAGVNSSNT